jgi:hypothetical protein
MATATEVKPKSARTIVSTKLTATGMRSEISSSASKQLREATELCRLLCNVKEFEEAAGEAAAALVRLREAADPKERT